MRIKYAKTQLTLYTRSRSVRQWAVIDVRKQQPQLTRTPNNIEGTNFRLHEFSQYSSLRKVIRVLLGRATNLPILKLLAFFIPISLVILTCKGFKNSFSKRKKQLLNSTCCRLPFCNALPKFPNIILKINQTEDCFLLIFETFFENI